MKIQLIDRNWHLCEAWGYYFDGCADVEVIRGDFFALETDCVVSPANSYGFMDGGLDAYITSVLGSQVQDNLQRKIKVLFNGELLIGQATLVLTDSIRVPYLISAPTMRVPMILPKDTVNPYLAMKATLLTVIDGIERGLKIKTITIPGFGTGVGLVDFDICARQMKQAYEDVIVNSKPFPISWREAQLQHIHLYKPNGTEDLQHGK